MKECALIAALILPHEGAVRDSVDALETNHVFSMCEGKYQFTQWLFWHDNEIAAWRMVKEPSLRPLKDHRTGLWVLIWNDNGVQREVWAATAYETWEQGDVEIYRRKFCPPEERRGLRP